MAEGSLSFSMQDKFGFQKLSVADVNGIRDGNLIVGMGSTAHRSYVKNNQLVMQVGTKTDSLTMTDMGTSTLYKGFLNTFQVTEIQVWKRGLRGFKIQGKISDLAFEAEVDSMTKQFHLKWESTELILWGNLNPMKQNGGCRGVMQAVSEEGSPSELGKFSCQSSGTLRDTLFKNPQDVIAMIVHLFIVPD